MYNYKTLSSINKKLKEQGSVMGVVLDNSVVDKKDAEDILTDYMKYFSAEDRIVMFVLDRNPLFNLSTFRNFDSALNKFGSLPEVHFVTSSSEVKAEKIFEASDFLKIHGDIPLWARIYKKYSEFSMGNSHYEMSGFSDMYNTRTMFDSIENTGKIPIVSTFTTYFEAETLFFIKYFEQRSVLDLGCGAGAFYHMLRSQLGSEIRYRGYDYGRSQVLGAIENFGPDEFDVADVSTISEDEFNSFDAIHAYNLFLWMPIEAQQKTLAKILRSKTQCFFNINLSVNQPDSVSQSVHAVVNDTLEYMDSVVCPPRFYPPLSLFKGLFDECSDRHDIKMSYRPVNAKFFDSPDNSCAETIVFDREVFHNSIKEGSIKMNDPKKTGQLIVAVRPKGWHELCKKKRFDFSASGHKAGQILNDNIRYLDPFLIKGAAYKSPFKKASIFKQN